MLLNQNPEEKIKSDFKIRKTRQIIAIFPTIASMFVILFVADKNPDKSIMGIPLLPVSVVVVVSVLIFSLWNWRCPSCNRYIGKAINPKFCSKCGIKLQQQTKLNVPACLHCRHLDTYKREYYIVGFNVINITKYKCSNVRAV